MGTGKRRSPSQIARDRRRIADLYLQGRLQVAIGEEVNLSVATISRDLKVLQGEWIKSALVDFDAKRAQELAKVDRLEREYWQAWQASKEAKISTSTEKTQLQDSERKKAQVKSEERNGDPRYLAGVQWCIEKRCKILGIDAPVKTDITTKGEKITDDKLTDAERLAALVAINKSVFSESDKYNQNEGTDD